MKTEKEITEFMSQLYEARNTLIIRNYEMKLVGDDLREYYFFKSNQDNIRRYEAKISVLEYVLKEAELSLTGARDASLKLGKSGERGSPTVKQNMKQPLKHEKSVNRDCKRAVQGNSANIRKRTAPAKGLKEAKE